MICSHDELCNFSNLSDKGFFFQLVAVSQDGLMTSAGVMQAQYVAIDVFRLRNLLVNTHGMITISVHVATEETQE